MSELGAKVARLALEHSTTLAMLKFLVHDLAKGSEAFDAYFGDFSPVGSFIENPPPTPTSYEELIQAVEALESSVDEVWNAVQSPSKKLAKGTKLSREEFYLLRSGLSVLVSDETLPRPGYDQYDEWELYCLHYYQDDLKAGYITPTNWQNAGEIERTFRVRPIKPNEVKKKSLSQEQLEFWESNYPNDFRLFKNY